jgi:hypothetical protein
VPVSVAPSFNALAITPSPLLLPHASLHSQLGGFGKARILPRLGGRGDPLEALSLAGGASHSTLVGADSAGSDGGLLSDGLVVVTASPGNCARCCSGGTPAASFAGDVYAFGELWLGSRVKVISVPIVVGGAITALRPF